MGELVRVEGSREGADTGQQAEPDEARAGGGQTRGRRRGRRGFGRLQRCRLGFQTALPMGGQQPVEVLEPVPLPGEALADRRHRLGHAARALVDVRGQRPAFPGELFQLPDQKGLPDPGVPVHMEQEPVPLVLRRQLEVLPERGPFGTAPHEPLPSALPDQLLHRRPPPHHPPVPPVTARSDRAPVWRKPSGSTWVRP